ncbi:putative cell wall-binding protein [Catenulispora sp. MAP12-49]|uniref:cell wall-binding repeat-containing protein n=1 Tax=Catenulispora sp. MAP12-49 TaxID=3156302 RepID=UPI0035116BD5
MVLPSSPPPPPPVTQPSVKRIGGSDRYQTSLLVSQAQWKDGSANAVVLARGDQAPDALAGVPLAAHVHGPLLLTDPSTLDRATSAEIARVTGGPAPDKTVYILGDNAAVSFPDALTGGAYAANAGMPLLITESDALAAPTLQQLSGWANALTAVTVFGGEKAVSSGVLSEIVSAVKGKVQ